MSKFISLRPSPIPDSIVEHAIVECVCYSVQDTLVAKAITFHLRPGFCNCGGIHEGMSVDEWEREYE